MSSGISAPFRDLQEKAISLFQSEAWGDLFALLRPILDPVESSPLWALQYGGAAAFHLGKLDEAELLLRKAMNVNPAEGWVSYFLGRVKLKQGLLASAISFLRQSVNSLPHEHWPVFFLLDALVRQGDSGSAQPFVNRLLPFKGELLGFEDLYQLWLNQSWCATGGIPSHGVMAWLVQLRPSEFLLLGWSSAADLTINLEGQIEEGAASREASYVHALPLERFPISEGHGWACLWQGAPPQHGWMLHGCVQQPKVLNLSQHSWSAAARMLIACLEQWGLADFAFSACLKSWLGAALSRLMPSTDQQLSLPIGTQVRHISGTMIDSPEISIILTVDDSWMSLRAQLMSFSQEALLQSQCVDVIIVLNNPSLLKDCSQWLDAFAATLDFPVRVAIHPTTFGQSRAWMTGALLATGHRLLMMRSNALSRNPGWLEMLQQELDRSKTTALVSPLIVDSCGAVLGGKIFFEDDPFHPTLPKLSISGRGLCWSAGMDPTPAPVVCSHAWLLDRSVFLKLGGFSGYMLNDDYLPLLFCLRLRHAGYHSYLLPSVQMVEGVHPKLWPKSLSPANSPSLQQLVDLVDRWLLLKLSEQF